ncbi:MAG: hypothetical protein KAH54_02640 [Candidatus Sabulitectum sp.]|nr:hypothetical protein [Candidatus Sabulitectum sp.]
MSDSLVDLLLVRLGKEDEKKKVLKLLISNLDLSVTDAEAAVKNSPSVIKEAVPMNQARIFQKDLYPYIDLLPRLEDEPVVEKTETDSAAAPVVKKETVSKQASSPEDDDDDQGDPVKLENYSRDADTEKEISEDDKPDGDNDEPVSITSASEEIRVTSRCHICGRTPTDGERLAPCRTCGELTCRNCFDRVAHVCNHCADKGKTVDRVNEGIEKDHVEERLEFDAEGSSKNKKKNSGSNGLRVVAVVAVVLALFAGFYFMDPLGMFSSDQTAVATDIDTTENDTLNTGITETSEDSTDLIEVATDTVEIVPDPFILEEDPFGLRYLTLPEGLVPDEDVAPLSFHLTLPRDVHAEIPAEESEILFDRIGIIASSIPVVVDDGVFLVYHDTTSVLVMVLLHPEDAGTRIRLMREIASWLAPSEIDQMVLIYRENRYQSAVPYSLLKEAFPNVEGVVSPSQFQGVLGYSEDCWESVSGPVTQWLSDLE